MSEVVTRFKENQGTCPCGCGVYGTLKNPRADGSRCVARKCRCVRCRNKSNQQRGKKRQGQAFRRIGYAGKFNPHDEESAGGPIRLEHKDGGKARPVVTAYERERAQSEAARPIGDPRPFVASYSVTTKHTYYVVRDDDLEAVSFGLAEAWGFGSDT